jgi:tetratricopeptide (TPR) repeat protein
MFSILIYLSIILVISFAVYRSYKSLDDSNFINFISIFGGWIAYQAQSLISIDQIGVGIWNWVLGGLIIAIGLRSYSHNNRELISGVNPNKASLVVSQRIYGFLLVLTTIIPISLLARGEIAIYKIRGAVSALYDQGGSVANRQETNQLIDSFLELNLQPNYSRFLVSRFQAELKLSDEGLERVKNLSLENPRNLDYLGFLAFYYENSQSYSEVLKYRLQIKKYDPYNLANLLIIGQIYKAQGNSNMSSQILNQINSLAPNSEISKSAKSLLS